MAQWLQERLNNGEKGRTNRRQGENTQLVIIYPVVVDVAMATATVTASGIERVGYPFLGHLGAQQSTISMATLARLVWFNVVQQMLQPSGFGQVRPCI